MKRKGRRAEDEGKGSSPFLSPPSAFILSFPFCSLFSLFSAESFGKEGRKERGEGRDKRARDGREREIARQSEEERERGRLNKKNLEREGNER